MAYDGLFAGAIANELAKELSGAKIEKVQQPEPDEILMQVNALSGRKKLLISISPQGARVQFTKRSYENPKDAPTFCMLLRKHIQGGRISAVRQIETERIIEFDIETVNEMGYSVNKRLIAETMGKHSNLVLTDMQSGKIIDAIKRISIDVNRYRQILPGMIYVMPPQQDKKSFWTVTKDEVTEILTKLPAEGDAGYRVDTKLSKLLMGGVQGLGSASAEAICEPGKPLDIATRLIEIRENIISGRLSPAVYTDEKGNPKDVHIFPLPAMESACNVLHFEETGDALDYFYSNRVDTNRVLQKCESFEKSVNNLCDKLLLKKQRLLEDIKKADEADIFRIKGELLTANISNVKPGAKSVTVVSYYDGSDVTIELDERFNAAKNAQLYFKKYTKAKGSKKEKLIQLEECENDIKYLESVKSMIPLAGNYEELELIRNELIREGYIRARHAKDKKPVKAKPRRFTLPCGLEIAVGRNNTENDYITFKVGQKTDYWFHTKDIPGSHTVLFTNGIQPGEDEIFQAAAAAAWFSKGKDSENVPVDYVPLRFVKKPAGAKPGMVIFTNNRTVWVNPKNPEEMKKEE